MAKKKAGRPPLPDSKKKKSGTLNIKIAQDVLDIIKSKDDPSAFVEAAILAANTLPGEIPKGGKKTIRELRRAMGLNQDSLAKRVGSKQRWISLIERKKKNVSMELAKKIAIILKVDVSELDCNIVPESVFNGKVLAELRGKAKLTQPKLAAKISTPKHHISEMEDDKRPISFAMAKKLCGPLNCNPTVFCDDWNE